MSEVNLMQGESETFWSRVRSALGAGRTQQAAERAPGYGQAALARSLGMKPRLGSRLEEELSEAWQVSGAAKVSLSLLVVEIDRYSDYFNAYGRSLAEECVATVFQTISETLPRAQDHCFKLGRNQFVVVLSDYPVLLANAGAEHLVLVTKTRQRLADLDYDFDDLATVMHRYGLVTVLLVWPESKNRYHARNPAAGLGVVEDPATGAAAAAFGGYLRELAMIGENAEFTISQGVDMGRPSEIAVSVIAGEPGVRVAGAAHRIDD